jgi:hypothetical protein
MQSGSSEPERQNRAYTAGGGSSSAISSLTEARSIRLWRGAKLGSRRLYPRDPRPGWPATFAYSDSPAAGLGVYAARLTRDLGPSGWLLR